MKFKHPFFFFVLISMPILTSAIQLECPLPSSITCEREPYHDTNSCKTSSPQNFIGSLAVYPVRPLFAVELNKYNEMHCFYGTDRNAGSMQITLKGKCTLPDGRETGKYGCVGKANIDCYVKCSE